jgi:hypothetical protein
MNTTTSSVVKGEFSFWRWFFGSVGVSPGYRRFLDRWIIFHIVVGIVLAMLVPVALQEAAASVLLPLTGIFVGLSFAWAGNAVALLQTKEMEDLSERVESGFSTYAFVFQMAILTILVSVVLWGVAGLKVFDLTWPTPSRGVFYFLTKMLLYSFSSVTLRECWHVVVGAQSMLLVVRRMRSVGNPKESIPQR